MTVDVGGVSGEITVSPSRLFFTPEEDWRATIPTRTVTVFAGEDFDADPIPHPHAHGAAAGITLAKRRHRVTR